jgi:Na+/melibiose symporter-like transporter
MVAFLVGAYLFAGGNAVIFIGCFAVAIFGLGLANAVPLSLYADTADYSEWKTGKNAKGVVMAIYNFPLKFALAISSGLVGYGLAAVGYVANADPTPQMVSSINFIVTLGPAILAALAIIIMHFYKLDEKKVADIKQSLANKAMGAK